LFAKSHKDGGGGVGEDREPGEFEMVLGPPVPVLYVVIVYRTIAYLSIVLA
jgi:hypothetical protein